MPFGSEAIKSKLESMGFEVEIKLGEKADIEAFRDAKKNIYDVVFIHGHGGSDGSINTGEVVPGEFNKSSNPDNESNPVGRGSTHNTNIIWKAVNASFWKGADFSGRLFYSNACSTFSKGSKLVTTLKEGKVSAAFGYRRGAYVPHSLKLALDIFSLAAESDKSILDAALSATELHSIFDAPGTYSRDNKTGLRFVFTPDDPDDPNNAPDFLLVCSNKPPKVSIATPLNNEKFQEGTAVIFQGLAEDSDGSIVSYEWDFEGDGSYLKQAPDTAHTYTKKGEYTISLRVTDNQASINTASVKIEIIGEEAVVDQNKAPSTPSISGPPTAKINELFSVNITRGKDPAGDGDDDEVNVSCTAEGSNRTSPFELGFKAGGTTETLGFSYSATGPKEIKCSSIDATGLSSPVALYSVEIKRPAPTSPPSTVDPPQSAQSGPPTKTPPLISPNGKVNTAKPTFTWEPVENATWYGITIGGDYSVSKDKTYYQNKFSAVDVGCANGESSCSWTLDQDIKDIKSISGTSLPTGCSFDSSGKSWCRYWWQVIAGNAAGWGDWGGSDAYYKVEVPE